MILMMMYYFKEGKLHQFSLCHNHLPKEKKVMDILLLILIFKKSKIQKLVQCLSFTNLYKISQSETF